MYRWLLAVSMSAAAFTGITRAQDRAVGFQSPSHNIFCQYLTGEPETVVRCDMMEATVTAPRPRDCDLEWGRGFEISKRRGRPGERICYGDTIRDPALPVLAHGATWQRGGFTCTSKQSGVTCINAERHGFTLSRAEQSVF